MRKSKKKSKPGIDSILYFTYIGNKYIILGYDGAGIDEVFIAQQVSSFGALRRFPVDGVMASINKGAIVLDEEWKRELSFKKDLEEILNA